MPIVAVEGKPTSANQVFLWVFLVPITALFVAGVGIWAVRRDPDSARARALRAAGLLGVGMLTQAMQRPDTAHFAWVSCVPLALLPAAIAELTAAKVAWPTWRRTFASVAPVAVIVPCHRVIRSNGSLSGYRWGVKIKETLLHREAALASRERK